MYNHIKVVDNWEIDQFTVNNSKFNNKFFAGQRIGNVYNEFLGEYMEEHLYIHQDGFARSSTLHLGEYTGYFDSVEEIEALITKGIKYETEENQNSAS